METNTGTGRGRGYNWMSIVVGIISIIVGVWCIFTPGSTLAALTLLFIIGFFAAGVFEICLAFAGGSNWGWRLAMGLIDLLLGIWLCAMPGAAVATVLVYVVGFYIFFYSALGIGESCHLGRLGVGGWGWMLFFSILGLIAAFFFLLSPLFVAGLWLSWLAGISFISYGIFRCLMP